MIKIFFRLIDILLVPFLMIRFIIWVVLTYIDSNYLRRRRKSKKVRILDFTTSSSYKAYKERGKLHNLTQQEEEGYIDKFYTIYPFKETSRTIKLSDRTTLIEWSSEKLSRWQDLGFKYSRYALIMWHFFHYCVKLIKDKNINIIRANNPFTSSAIAFICSRLARVPFCVHIRTVFEFIPKVAGSEYYPRVLGSQKLSRLIQRFVLSHCDVVVPLSVARGEYAIEQGAKPKKIRVIPRVIDVNKFPQPDPTLKKELGIEDKRVISFVGRLVKINYIYDVIHIAANVCSQRNDAIFLMVGDGDERKPLEELSHNLGLDDSVKFLGMQQWQKAMQIRLLSDVSLCLMAGNSLVEAAVAATPLVAYDVDWHYELVRNDETGFLLPEGDINGAAAAIIKLLENPELGRRMGQNARELAIKRHSTEKVRQLRIELYEELIQR